MAKAPWAFKDVLTAAAITQPSSNIRKFPLDKLADVARSGTPRVVEAQAKVERLRNAFESEVAVAEAYLATLKNEFEAKIIDAEIELNRALTERRQAQHKCLRDMIESDVFVDVKDLNELARTKEFEAK